jgi:hypothetical protein
VKKWCTYCRKDNHSDSECWCTRAVTYAPQPYIPGPEALWSLSDAVARLGAAQKPLDADIAKALRDNAWELYQR